MPEGKVVCRLTDSNASARREGARQITPPQDFVLHPAPSSEMGRLEDRALVLGVTRPVPAAVVNERVHILAEQLFRLVTEHLCPVSVDEGAVALQVHPINPFAIQLQK